MLRHRGTPQDLEQDARLLQASVSLYLQWRPTSWSLRSPSTTESKPSPAALSGPVAQPQVCPGAAEGSHEREEPGNPGGAPPAPTPPPRAGARRRRGRRLPPETRSRCARRCQHSWKVTQAERGGGGTAAARCQMCTANSCPRLIRSAPGSGEPRAHRRLRPPGTRRRASQGGLEEGPEHALRPQSGGGVRTPPHPVVQGGEIRTPWGRGWGLKHPRPANTSL